MFILIPVISIQELNKHSEKSKFLSCAITPHLSQVVVICILVFIALLAQHSNCKNSCRAGKNYTKTEQNKLVESSVKNDYKEVQVTENQLKMAEW